MYLITISRNCGFDIYVDTHVTNNITRVIELCFKTYYSNNSLFSLDNRINFDKNCKIKINKNKYITGYELINGVVCESWLYSGGITLGNNDDGEIIIDDYDFSKFLIDVKENKESEYPKYEDANNIVMKVKYFVDETSMTHVTRFE